MLRLAIACLLMACGGIELDEIGTLEAGGYSNVTLTAPLLDCYLGHTFTATRQDGHRTGSICCEESGQCSFQSRLTYPKSKQRTAMK